MSKFHVFLQDDVQTSYKSKHKSYGKHSSLYQ